MSGCVLVKKISRPLLSALILLCTANVFFSCAGSSGGTLRGESEKSTSGAITDTAAGNTANNPGGKEKEFIALLTVSSPQETEYSGLPQPLKYSYKGKDEPLILYYPSSRARGEGRGGSYEAPVKTGVYYVHIVCRDEEEFAEYRIIKRRVKIEAEEVQTAVYNGDPKRVEVYVEPEITLFYTYYQNRELMEAARNTVRQAEAEGKSLRVPSDTYTGYKRVEHAPIEQGTYFVWVYYPGDENNESAEVIIEFTILPPW